MSGRAGWRPPPALRLAWHPATLLAALALVVNDHLLKPWGGCAWLAGKLSDAAGLFVLPIALFVIASFLFPRRLRVLAAACTAAVGLCFALVKTWPAFNAGYSSAVSAMLRSLGVGGRLRILVDPTDLLVLPVLGGAWWLMRREASRPAARGETDRPGSP